MTVEVAELVGAAQITGRGISSIADNAILLRYVEVAPCEVDVLERAIAALRHTRHPALHLLRARLEAAYRL